ncbi:GDP-L-fucose synthase family protein [Solidesulfovibrio magneticus]|uniref:GDP-L-fucose synthase n=1 Tax=Solidesulfovibrio magneticus (strain ATCC 700980 / DSM 13731 / RS-1) TaxID=573370 RepID=C4XUJ7_SOLM1|nr:GDP-L-fucose synthase [Solidesulfovibrio magneticus]BAH73448.1 GDP-L-fucose synthetase [Solidesulfovibrio magneticus RS-1]
MHNDARVFIAGGGKAVCRAIRRALAASGVSQVAGAGDNEPDYADQAAVERFFADFHPEYVFIAGGKAGGIGYNRAHPATLGLDNLLLATHVMDAARRHGVKKLVNLASSCCYPKVCPQPMAEEHLMTGPLEPTNEAYAQAKLAGMALAKAYRQEYGLDYVTAIPTNYFGPGDDFSPENSHVVGALLSRFHAAKHNGDPEVVVWGTGRPRREFLYVDDVASACLAVMDGYSDEAPINIAGGEDLSIAELAAMAGEVVGYQGALRFAVDKPDGMMQKRLDASKLLALGWSPAHDFKTALRHTYQWFCGQSA